MPIKQNMSRRNALQVGVCGATQMCLSGLLRARESSPLQAKADAVIFVNLAGGVSHLDTLDMKPAGPAETRGEFQPIQSSIPGLVVCEHLPRLARCIDQFTLIRGIHHSAGAHPQGQSWISTGNRPTPALLYPSFGSVVTKELSGQPDLPSYVAIPKSEWNAGFMGDAYAPFQTNAVPKPGTRFQVRGVSLAEGVTVEQVNRREALLRQVDRTFREIETHSQLLQALDKFSEQAHSIITSTRALRAFDVEQESPAIRQRFGDDELNQGTLLACRLVENGVRFVTVSNGGWDTHLDNFNGHKRLLQPLDQALPAMLETLRDKGLLERTLVIVMGEFGRTPKINENAGRDHFPQVNWCLMAGGGVQSGQLLGGSNAAGDAADDATDITPDDLAATLYHALGIDPTTEYHTQTGRPVMLVPEGRILSSLFG
ncbi:MAG: DUF1501 domain-containing protein [Planctomycetales bacterium]|nr:DUF1501 domain-containing protein [Planctomycetales bacterium]